MKSKMIQKKIIATAISVCLILAVFAGAFVLYSEGFFVKKTDSSSGSFNFYEADYNYDIMQDPIYRDHITPSFIIYRDEAVGKSISVSDETYADYDNSAVGLLIRLLLAIQSGDDGTYNSCFGDDYLAAVGKDVLRSEGKDPSGYGQEELISFGRKGKFTAQKVYDAVITDMGSSKRTDEGKEFTAYYFRLEYKIRHNNGTLRTDMDSDSVRPQDIVITDDNLDGELKIRSVTVHEYGLPAAETPIISRIILAAVIGTAIVAGSVTGLLLYFRKLGKQDESEKEKNEKASGN